MSWSFSLHLVPLRLSLLVKLELRWQPEGPSSSPDTVFHSPEVTGVNYDSSFLHKFLDPDLDSCAGTLPTEPPLQPLSIHFLESTGKAILFKIAQYQYLCFHHFGLRNGQSRSNFRFPGEVGNTTGASFTLQGKECRHASAQEPAGLLIHVHSVHV